MAVVWSKVRGNIPGAKVKKANKTAVTVRNNAILERIVEGQTYSQVAAEFDLSIGRISQIVTKALAHHQSELVEQRRAVLDARIHSVWAANFRERLNPQNAAILLRCIEQWAKLWGTNAPERSELSGPGGVPLLGSEQARAMAEELLRTSQITDDHAIVVDAETVSSDPSTDPA